MEMLFKTKSGGGGADEEEGNEEEDTTIELDEGGSLEDDKDDDDEEDDFSLLNLSMKIPKKIANNTEPKRKIMKKTTKTIIELFFDSISFCLEHHFLIFHFEKHLQE